MVRSVAAYQRLKTKDRRSVTAANEQRKNETIMKHWNQILSGSITGLMGLVATSVMAADAAQYSSKAALFGSRTEPYAMNVGVSAVAHLAPAVGSKPWLWPSQPVMSMAVKSKKPTTLLLNNYNSKKSVRGERESVQPVFHIAPLK